MPKPVLNGHMTCSPGSGTRPWSGKLVVLGDQGLHRHAQGLGDGPEHRCRDLAAAGLVLVDLLEAHLDRLAQGAQAQSCSNAMFSDATANGFIERSDFTHRTLQPDMRFQPLASSTVERAVGSLG